MALNLEALLEPVSEDNPAGEDLSYSDARVSIEAAFEASARADDDAPAVDWRSTIDQIADQAAQTKDLWLAVYLMRAGAKSGDFEAVAIGAEFLAGLVDAFWDSVHPQLDEYGFVGRKGACESLTRIAEFLGPLRRTVLVEHSRLGSYSGADFERFSANGDAEEGYGMFRAALQELGQDDIGRAIASLDRVRDAIRRADLIMTDNSGEETATNFAPTYAVIAQIRSAVAAFSEAEEDAAQAGADDSTGDDEGASGGGAGPRIGGRVESREDVIKAIDVIVDYYRRREPNSPVPLALKRARSWVGLDFLAVLEDIVPASLDDARKVLVTGRESGTSSEWSE